jgi:hypothetical protein
VALAFVVVHLIFLGVAGWLASSDWHAGIPPISLVAVVAALVPLAVKRTWVGTERSGPARSALGVERLAHLPGPADQLLEPGVAP